MYFTYIIQSTICGRYYIGSCENIDKRLLNHNDGLVTSTKAYQPWVVVYQEKHKTRGEARKREIQIKRYKGGEAFKKLVS